MKQCKKITKTNTISNNNSTTNNITIIITNRELADRRTSWGVQELLQGQEGQQPLLQVVVVDDDGDCGGGCDGDNCNGNDGDCGGGCCGDNCDDDDGDDQQPLLQVVVVDDVGCGKLC